VDLESVGPVPVSKARRARHTRVGNTCRGESPQEFGPEERLRSRLPGVYFIFPKNNPMHSTTRMIGGARLCYCFLVLPRTDTALRRCKMTAQLGPFVKAKKSTSDPGKLPAARPGSQPISHEQRATSLVRTPADADRMVIRGEGIEIELGSYAQLKEMFGTDDRFAKGMLSQLASAGARGKIDEDKLNFILSIVKGTKPRDQLEAMLAAQMAATHMATMTFARRLANVDHPAAEQCRARV
jgi:hypothetical protein